MDTVISTFQELKRLHQLNLELLEQLNVACGWILEHNIQVPNSQSLYSLLLKAKCLIDEIHSDEPKILQYSAIRRKVTEPTKPESDGEVTEPCEVLARILSPA